MWYLSWWADSYMTSTFWSLHLVNPLPFELGVTCELLLFFLFFRVFFFYPHLTCFHCFLERVREKGKHRCKTEASTGCLWYVPRPGIIHAWTGDQTCNLGMYPLQESNPQPFIYRTTLQPMQPHGLGLCDLLLNNRIQQRPAKWQSSVLSWQLESAGILMPSHIGYSSAY